MINLFLKERMKYWISILKPLSRHDERKNTLKKTLNFKKYICKTTNRMMRPDRTLREMFSQTIRCKVYFLFSNREGKSKSWTTSLRTL